MRGVLRLLRIQPPVRIPRIDGTEPARARTDRAHEHDGRGAGVPALTNIRALRLLADRREPVLFDDGFDALETRARRGLGPQPGRLPSRRSPRRGGDRSRGSSPDDRATLRLDAVTNSRKPLRRNVFLATARPRHFLDDRNAFQVGHSLLL